MNDRPLTPEEAAAAYDAAPAVPLSEGRIEEIVNYASGNTELQAFEAMLKRVGIGHGLRIDYSPPGTSVMVEHDGETQSEWTVTDWSFDHNGKLIGVSAYKGAEE